MVVTEPMPRSTARLSETWISQLRSGEPNGIGLIERHQLLHCGLKRHVRRAPFHPDACCGIDHLPSHLILTQIKVIISGDPDVIWLTELTATRPKTSTHPPPHRDSGCYCTYSYGTRVVVCDED